MRRLLLPLSWLYGAGIALRNRAFDAGVLRSTDAGVPVISVGNLTMGGTGKTPLVEYIARILLDRGVRVAVISRGYGRSSKGVVVVSDGIRILADASTGGDEPLQIARRLRGVSVVVAEHRTEGARVAVKDLSAQVLVLDDGYQHRWIRRAIDIVVIDSRSDITREPMIPAGRRREPMSGLRRAGVVAFSKSDPPFRKSAWRGRLGKWYKGQCMEYRYVVDGIRSIADDREVTAEALRGATVFAFSGVADHTAFLETARSFGVRICGETGFGDHHVYTAPDMEELSRKGREAGASLFLTTEKDAVKLGPFAEKMPMAALRVSVEIVEGEADLMALIDRGIGAEDS